MEILSEATKSLGAAEHGYPVLCRRASCRERSPTASHSRGSPCRRSTRTARRRREALLSSMHDRAVAGQNGASAPELHAAFRVLPTRRSTVSSPRPCRPATGSRVVELRLDRVETLSTAAQRAQELTASRGSFSGSSTTRTARSTSSSTRARWSRSARPCSRRSATPTRRAVARRRSIPRSTRGRSLRTGAPGRWTRRSSTPCSSRSSASRSPSTWRWSNSHAPWGPCRPSSRSMPSAWEALRAPGFDEAVAAVLAAIHDAAVAARLEQLAVGPPPHAHSTPPRGSTPRARYPR